MHTIGKATTAVMAAVFAIAMTTVSSLAASDFEGVWKVKDTAGQPFEITLSGGGAAKASRGEGMAGTWKEEGKTAVITWNTGWTTKIAKEGDQYKKTAYGKRATAGRSTERTQPRWKAAIEPVVKNAPIAQHYLQESSGLQKTYSKLPFVRTG